MLTANLRLADDVDFRWLAKATPGYVGADLTSLVTEAGVTAIKRIFQDLSREVPTTDINGDVEIDGAVQESLQSIALSDDGPLSTLPTEIRETPIARFLLSHKGPVDAANLSSLSLQSTDFAESLKIVQPSAKREGFATIPDVSWADIGALGNVRDELHMAIVQPIRHPELFSVVGIDAPSGVLLWGPPGCGKTLLAKAVANESRANFISVKGPELLNKVLSAVTRRRAS